MSLELELANERAKQFRQDAANYRRAKQARGSKNSSAWTRLFKAARWGGSHARREQLM